MVGILGIGPGFALAAEPGSVPVPMHRVPEGTYEPFQPVEGEPPVAVAAFELDERPVTNAEFLSFVTAQPTWRRSRAPRLFVDDAYLVHWKGDLELGESVDPSQPVTFVSWFAASAYCRSHGKRLPTEAEWEWAADASRIGEAAEAEANERVLAFYSRPRGRLPRAGQSAPNDLGLRDLHGVIWEWVDDFHASFASTDSRKGGERELDLVCGGGAIASADPKDYAAFMRYAFRSSLEATFSIHHLGFRCARSTP